MTIHTMLTINKRVCPSCGREGEYLGALLDMSGQEEREYLFWKCLDCRQEWQTKKENRLFLKCVEAEKSPNGQCPEDWDEEGEHDD